MATVSVRYIVDDVDAGIAFYTKTTRLPRRHASGTDIRDALPRRPALTAQPTKRGRRRRSNHARRHQTAPPGKNHRPPALPV